MSEEVEAIREDLFRIRVPLPNNPLRELNSYVIRDGQQSLIIDTGFNRPACLEVMERGIAELGLDLNKTDFSSPISMRIIRGWWCGSPLPQAAFTSAVLMRSYSSEWNRGAI